MKQLVDSNGNRLSRICRRITPTIFEPIVVKNRLLDGTMHVQTIGSPIKKLEFEIVADGVQVDKINVLQAQYALVSLGDEAGFISERIAWSRLHYSSEKADCRYVGQCVLELKE